MSKEISRTTFRERYRKLRDHLKTIILTGELLPGEYIPPEMELANDFQLSKPSVRKVLQELAEEGLIRTYHGKGSVVTEVEKEATVLQLFWAMPSFIFPTIDYMVHRFNQLNRRIKVEMTQVPTEALENASQGLFMGKVKPDLIGMNNNEFMRFYDQSLEERFQPVELEEIQEIYDPIVQAFRKRNRLYAAPFTFSTVVLAYNKAMFDEAGLPYPAESWNWNDLLEAAKRMTITNQAQVEQYGFGCSTSLNRWPLFVLQNGGSFASDDGPFPDDPRTVEALQWIADLVYKHKVAPGPSIGNDNMEELFKRGKVGMIVASYISSEQFRDCDFSWDIVRFPGSFPEAAIGLATGIAISRHCTSVSAANEFLSFLLSVPMQAYQKSHANTIPVNKQVAESRNYPHFAFDGKGYYTFEPLMPYMKTINDLGLTKEQLDWMEKELSLLWANLDRADQVWLRLREMAHSQKLPS